MVFCLCVGVFGATATLTRLHSSIFRPEFFFIFIPVATHQESECVAKKIREMNRNRCPPTGYVINIRPQSL